MEPENLRFGGGAAETMLHPVVAVWMLVAIVLIIVLPRKSALSTFLLAVFTIPLGQVIVLGGIHFTVLRVLILAGVVRRTLYPSAAKFPGGFNAIDRMVILWTLAAFVILNIQWMNVGILIRSTGDLLDALGGYLVIRWLIADEDAVRTTVKVFAVICLIQGVLMLNEQISKVNVFGYLGGMQVAVTIRDGKIRSQGVLGSIFAGVFAGALIPLFIWLWSKGRCKTVAAAGLVGALSMVVTSNSSTSWMAVAGSVVGMSFWSLRSRMRQLRWALALGLTAVHLVMKAPVWALIARVDLTGSSSSFHRYYLVDQCIRHFSDWCLLGYRYYNTWGWDMWDLCNQFVAVALTGGLITLICYVLIFSRSFSAIGTARKIVAGDRNQEWFLWCLGSVLFSHVVAHFGINYMAMGMMGLFPLFACISVVYAEIRRSSQSPISTVRTLEEDASYSPYSLPAETPLKA